MTELSAQEKNDWFERTFGTSGELMERRDGGYIVQVNRRPGTVEYRTASFVALPSGRTLQEYQRQTDRLIAWSRDLDRKLEALTDR
jgi:uncharacterized protein YceH (UPF0502 family)